MTAGLDLSVVVPLYNEEESLPELVEQLLTALRPTGERFELVLVNDGSTDGCLLYTSPSPRDNTTSRMPSSA